MPAGAAGLRQGVAKKHCGPGRPAVKRPLHLPLARPPVGANHAQACCSSPSKNESALPAGRSDHQQTLGGKQPQHHQGEDQGIFGDAAGQTQILPVTGEQIAQQAGADGKPDQQSGNT